MYTKFNLFKIIPLVLFITSLSVTEFCYSDNNCCSDDKSIENSRFLFYDVNPPEGFNLRRDVYMRFAILAHKLQRANDSNLKNFKLVLPPWSHLYHWTYNPQPEHIPWGLFFDIESLKSFAPVIEMYEFFNIWKKYSIIIDEIYILQHFKDMFESGNFEERMQIDECSDSYQLNYFFYKNVTGRNVKCLSFHGPATKLLDFLNKTTAKTLLFHHAEVALHEMFGNRLYWQCRRSMRFNKELKNIAADFRRKFLNSTDDLDRTILPEKWEDEKSERKAIGGPYLAVHLRRKDFLKGRSHQVPSTQSISSQITQLLKKLQLTQVFIATDATNEEYRDVISKIPSKFKTLKYIPDDLVKTKFKEGGIAIIEQIICAHARFFIGTYESTFSFRIQEEREILGFRVNTTFNSFCKYADDECTQPSVWKIESLNESRLFPLLTDRVRCTRFVNSNYKKIQFRKTNLFYYNFNKYLI